MPTRRFTKIYHKPDYVLVISFLVIVIIGLIMLSSAGSVVSYERFGDSYYYFKHHFFSGVLPGIVLFFLASRFDYRRLRKLAFPLLLVSLGLLLLVFIPSIASVYGGSRSWVTLFGIQFQPSEVVKLTFILYLSIWLASRQKKEVQDVNTGLLPFLSLLGVVSLLMILQPDIGTLSIIIVSSFAVFFASGAKVTHLIAVGSGGLVALFALIKMAPYRAARFTTFLHPELDPLGMGYHINQALLAIGSGGLFGRGFGESRQKFHYLPEVIGDSIFAVIAEELGFFITVLIIVLFLVMMYRGFKVAQNASDNLGRLIAVGITSWFSFQAFVNIGAMLAVLPLTGLPLPFISYGGSALAISMAAMGVLVNISKQTKEL